MLLKNYQLGLGKAMSVRFTSQLARTRRCALSSREIRDRFCKYFAESHDHKFVRSSPVVPLCDPSVAFVNAGMNQFKSVFLGQKTPPSKRVVNSQKCIRVGGKHNDLNIVGTDGYHHTFFEMLGNWSFGDYFKRDACQMAWDLIVKEYKIDPAHLYVTYFGGDTASGLPVDEECYNIWREIGVPKDRILAFGSKENFWEMGPTGPCGPCSEIHFDHRPAANGTQTLNRSALVNRDLPDLTELWNIVFIQYMRHPDGSMSQLPEKHIDTGMGLERLSAVLQGSMSNYESDLFTPIFDQILKVSTVSSAYSGIFDPEHGNYKLDTAYRLMADHCRMITACLADGMFPDQNHKLRRVLRKVLLLSDRVFNCHHLPNEIVPVIGEIFGDVYPEIPLKVTDILAIIDHEKEIVDALRRSCSKEVHSLLNQIPNGILDESDFLDNTGLFCAFKDLQKSKASFKRDANLEQYVFPYDYVTRLLGTYGLDEDTIERLGQLENICLPKDAFARSKMQLKREGQLMTSQNLPAADNTDLLQHIGARIPITCDDSKYNYRFNRDSNSFVVDTIKSKIVAIIDPQNQIVDSIESKNDEISVIFDRTNFYCEAGGQASDIGRMKIDGAFELPITGVYQLNGRILHQITTNGIGLAVGDTIDLTVDSDTRTGNIIHHSTIHLLNRSIRDTLKCLVYQKSSGASTHGSKLEVGVIGGARLDRINVAKVEEQIRQLIKRGCPVETSIIDYETILKDGNITTVPGEVYPENNLRLLSIVDDHFQSRELCCGTHVQNISQIGDMCVTSVKLLSRGTYQITAVAGRAATKARAMGAQMEVDVNAIQADLENGKLKIENIETRVHRLKSILQQGFHKNFSIPYVVKIECLEVLNGISKEIRDKTRDTLKEFIEIEMRAVLADRPSHQFPFIVYNLSSSVLMEDVKLQKATRLCPDRPVLVVCQSSGLVKARACVPQHLVTDEFNALIWLQTVAAIFGGQLAPPKGQNPAEVCNMKAVKVATALAEDQIELATEEAITFAKRHF